MKTHHCKKKVNTKEFLEKGKKRQKEHLNRCGGVANGAKARSLFVEQLGLRLRIYVQSISKQDTNKKYYTSMRDAGDSRGLVSSAVQHLT